MEKFVVILLLTTLPVLATEDGVRLAHTELACTTLNAESDLTGDVAEYLISGECMFLRPGPFRIERAAKVGVLRYLCLQSEQSNAPCQWVRYDRVRSDVYHAVGLQN
jgi:hypothetical protein